MKDEVGKEGGHYVSFSLGLVLCPLYVRVTHCGNVLHACACVRIYKNVQHMDLQVCSFFTDGMHLIKMLLLKV